MGWIIKLNREGDDINGIKRTLLDTDAAPDTELFRDLCFSVFPDDDGLITGSYARTVDDAFVATFFEWHRSRWTTARRMDDQRRLVVRRIVQVMNQMANVMKPW
jgi:hypothetical protein